ncbi:MAG: beta-N-acetylhexosaminidase, partial [Muribaculaceae bacterium]|nr:beta-N-acetylhexosaminidase [Muribaculaceae bacterium]
MKHRFTLLLVTLMCCFGLANSASFINLTPRPAKMTEGSGTLALTSGMKVGYEASLPADMQAEAVNFVAALNESTGLGASVTEGSGLINVALDSTQPAEGYTLSVTTSGATLKAATPAGLFYGFQTIKKLLPANVMAGVMKAGNYALPAVEIADQPRFEYRGFMLDVSRHFFDKEQVMKMLDIMAMYKLNRFHWHLTDDQGWRLPMAKYPKLTVEGATNRNILRTDFDQQKQWREGKDVQYGPYAYTIEDLKEVVAYAKKLHIEVMPEIDMPGHMVAAIHAYPEFSTDPDSKIAIDAGIDLDSEPVAGTIESHFTHNIWNGGGVSKDVLDISNPKVIEFTKDVIDVLAEVFPYEYIHIGGDECPTWAWERSESCTALKDKVAEEFGLTASQATYRALQNWFTKQVGDYALEKYGKRIMGWNELITAGGAHLPFLASTRPAIMCWVGANSAAERAEKMKLPHIFTPHDGGYYINRCYRGIDKVGAVGHGSLSLTYNTNPPENENLIGVHGTFWCEQVDRNRD